MHVCHCLCLNKTHKERQITDGFNNINLAERCLQEIINVWSAQSETLSSFHLRISAGQSYASFTHQPSVLFSRTLKSTLTCSVLPLMNFTKTQITNAAVMEDLNKHLAHQKTVLALMKPKETSGKMHAHLVHQ